MKIIKSEVKPLALCLGLIPILSFSDEALNLLSVSTMLP